MPDDSDLLLDCPRGCGLVLPMLSWQEHSNGTVHLRADCPSCKRWIKYCPQRDDQGPTVYARAIGVVE